MGEVMLCYRDKTFCTAKCATYSCTLMVKPVVEEAAESVGLPLMLADRSDECDRYQPLNPTE